MSTISIILPTCGRSTFRRALNSVLPQLADADELLVIGDGPQPAVRDVVAESEDRRLKYWEHGPTRFYGNAQRNVAMAAARGELIAFLDDDDDYYDGALAAIRQAAAEHPGRPFMFRLKCDRPNFVVWRTPRIKAGNISGGAFVVPNRPERLGRWPTPKERRHRCSDVTFIEDTLALYPPDALIWRKDLIYHVPRRSHNAC